jgi:hypothetical protein
VRGARFEEDVAFVDEEDGAPFCDHGEDVGEVLLDTVGVCGGLAFATAA